MLKNISNRLLHTTFLIAACLLLSGFNLDNALIPAEEILSGGPPKDGIPAILNPNFLPPENASFLGSDDQVIGVRIGTESKAYPIKILNHHEVVNDSLGGVPIAVTF